MDETENTTPPDVARGHEVRDISTRVVALFGAALLVGAVAVHAMIWLLYLYFGSVADRAVTPEFPLARAGAPAEPPEPRLQTRPREELKRMRAEEERILNTYGWVDPNAGIVYIPIERAMKMALEQGLPTRPGAVADPFGRPPDRANSGRPYVMPERSR